MTTIGNLQSGLRHSTTDSPDDSRRSTSVWAKDPASDALVSLSNGHSAGFNELNAESKGVTIENSPLSNTDTGYAAVVGAPIYYDNMVNGISAVAITPSSETLKWDYTPFVATEEYHISTKKYVDDRMIVSETEPTSGAIGQQWFQPSTGNLHVFTGDA